MLSTILATRLNYSTQLILFAKDGPVLRYIRSSSLSYSLTRTTTQMNLSSLNSQSHTVHLFLSTRLVYLRAGTALANTPVLYDCFFIKMSSLFVIFAIIFIELFDYGSIRVTHAIFEGFQTCFQVFFSWIQIFLFNLAFLSILRPNYFGIVKSRLCI